MSMHGNKTRRSILTCTLYRHLSFRLCTYPSCLTLLVNNNVCTIYTVAATSVIQTYSMTDL